MYKYQLFNQVTIVCFLIIDQYRFYQFFSKILERIMYNRLMYYININQILFKNQYGFRKNHSTSLALINSYDKISTGL
jgi:hypothetical protein